MQDYRVEVIQKIVLKPDVIELLLRLIKPKSMRFRAGQFVFFKIDGAFKAYSITSVPSEKGLLRFLIKLEKKGRASLFVKNIRPGDSFELSGPEGDFTIKSRSKDLCFVAFGVGIAPVLSILSADFLKHYQAKVVLFVAASSGGVPYLKNWKTLQKKYSHFHFNLALDPRKKMGAVVQKYAVSNKKSLFYLSGGGKSVAEAQSALEKAQIPLENIHEEIFYPSGF
jgi:ferredoxin-NADP reductase